MRALNAHKIMSGSRPRAAGGCDPTLLVMEEADLCIRFHRLDRTRLVNRVVITSDRRVAAWGALRANWIYAGGSAFAKGWSGTTPTCAKISKPHLQHGTYSFYFWDGDDNCWEILTSPEGGYSWLFERGDQPGKGHLDRNFKRPGVVT